MEKKYEYKMFASKMREDLYRNLKLLSAAEDKPIQAIIEEAVVEYLVNRKFKEESSDKGSVTLLKVSYSAPPEKKGKPEN